MFLLYSNLWVTQKIERLFDLPGRVFCCLDLVGDCGSQSNGVIGKTFFSLVTINEEPWKNYSTLKWAS